MLTDGQGEAIALVTTDLFAGSAWIHEAVSAQVAAETGLTTDRILIAASHTHHGPAHLLGTGTMDCLTSPYWRRGPAGCSFDLPTASRIAARLAGGIRTAWRCRRPARVGLGDGLLWGHVWHRAGWTLDAQPTPPATEAGPRGMGTWLSDGLRPPSISTLWADLRAHLPSSPHDRPPCTRLGRPSNAVPALEGCQTPRLDERLADLLRSPRLGTLALGTLSLRRSGEAADQRAVHHRWTDKCLVDPRVRVIWAIDSDNGADIGGFATVAAWSGGLGVGHALYSGDALSFAHQQVRRQLAREGTDAPIGVGGGALAESRLVGRSARPAAGRSIAPTSTVITPHDTADLLDQASPDLQACARRCAEVGNALAGAILEGIQCARTEASASWRLQARMAEPAPARTHLPGRPLNPGPTLGVQGLAQPLVCARDTPWREGLTDRSSWPSDQPKSPLLPWAVPPTLLPVRALALLREDGPSVHIFGAPMVVTSALAAELRDEVRALDAGSDTIVCSAAGDYQGAACTTAEYDAQARTGARTIWGRHTGDLLKHVASELLAAPPPALATEAAFGSRPIHHSGRPVSPRHHPGRGAPVSACVPPNPWTTPHSLPRFEALQVALDSTLADGRLQLVGDKADPWLVTAWDARADDARTPLSDRPIATLFRAAEGGHHALQLGSLVLDDRSLPAFAWRSFGQAGGRWAVAWRLADIEQAVGAVDPTQLAVAPAPWTQKDPPSSGLTLVTLSGRRAVERPTPTARVDPTGASPR